MLNRKLSRREILLGSVGLGALAGIALSPARSMAMTEKQLQAGSELGLAYANRCGSADAGAHAQLISDLQAVLMQEPGQKGEILTRTAVCPICGCPVTATRTVM